MSPLMDLVIHTPFAGCEEHFAEAVAVREHREHWSGNSGAGGDVRPESRLHEVLEDRDGQICDNLMAERGWSAEDFRHAARRLEAAGHHDLSILAQHVRAMELFVSEKEMEQMSNATESMTRQLISGQSEEYLREQRTPINRADPKGQHPRASGWMNYPTNARPVAEPAADSNRAVRGATEPAMSEKLRSLAAEVQRLSGLSGNARQRNRLMARASELRRMSSAQYQRELENDVATSSDPTEPSNVLNGLARDMDDEARAGGAQPDDSFGSYDDWSDRPTADEQLADDVQDQRDDALQLDREDVPHVPQPGRRYAEDQLGDPAAGTDEPRGLRRNRSDDDLFQRLRRGKVPADAGQPRGDDRYGHRVRYSGLKRESMRESGDMTQFILDELAIADFAAHSHF